MGQSRDRLGFVRGKRFWAILALSIFHFYNLYYLLSSDTNARSHVAYAQGNDEFLNLTCEQTVRLALWGKSRSRHAQEANLESRAFAKKALQAFIEKMDPYRLLFTEAEVKKFQSEALRPWRKWIREKKCDYFDRWTDTEFKRVKGRLDATLQSLEMPALEKKAAAKQTTKPTGDLAEDSPKFIGFASNEKELKTRLTQWVERIYQGATAVTLKAYAGDTRKLVTDAVVQLLFEADPDAHALIAKAALSSMDPYSTYFSPSEFEDFYYDLSGGTSGIGIKVRKVPAGLLVEKVVSDSPAGRSKKIKEGHIIIAVDNKKVAGLSTAASKSLLKGGDGTRVKLEIKAGAGKPFTVTVTRKHFTFEEAKISHRILKSGKKGRGGVAVITIPSFYGRGGMGSFEEERSSSEDLRTVVSDLVKGSSKPAALILDLRGNPGGFLEEAVAMAGTFLGDQPVVEVVESDSKRILRDDQGKPLYQGPLILLLDEETASASEVLAGALKDHQRAVLVGAETTYGKGSVQKLFHLDDELMRIGLSPLLGKGVVKLTTSVFYSPLGHTPANGGVRSHIALPSKKMAEEEEPHPSVGEIPEEEPFLDEASMAEVKKKEEVFRPRLSALEELSRKRVNLLVQQDLTGNEEEQDQWELDEAVAIANDFAALQTEKDLGAVAP